MSFMIINPFIGLEQLNELIIQHCRAVGLHMTARIMENEIKNGACREPRKASRLMSMIVEAQNNQFLQEEAQAKRQPLIRQRSHSPTDYQQTYQLPPQQPASPYSNVDDQVQVQAPLTQIIKPNRVNLKTRIPNKNPVYNPNLTSNSNFDRATVQNLSFYQKSYSEKGREIDYSPDKQFAEPSGYGPSFPKKQSMDERLSQTLDYDGGRNNNAGNYSALDINEHSPTRDDLMTLNINPNQSLTQARQPAMSLVQKQQPQPLTGRRNPSPFATAAQRQLAPLTAKNLNNYIEGTESQRNLFEKYSVGTKSNIETIYEQQLEDTQDFWDPSIVKIGYNQYRLSEKMKADLVRLTWCSEAEIHKHFEYFTRIMNKETKSFGKNELYDFLNSLFGITSPTFSDMFYQSFDLNNPMRQTMTFKEVFIGVVAPFTSKNQKEFVRVIFKAYHKQGVGAKQADMDRMLRGITKGSLTEVASHAREKLKQAQELLNQTKKVAEQGYLTFAEVEQVGMRYNWPGFTNK